MTSQTYTEAKATSDALSAEVDRLSTILNTFPVGPMGLVSDEVRASAEFRAAKGQYATAFQRLRAFNGSFTKTFRKEIAQSRHNRFAA